MSENLSAEERAVEERDVLGVRATMAVGMDIEAFMRSTSGRALAARANADMQLALEALASVDPTDSSAVVKAQMDYRIPAAVLSYLGELVEEGKNAEAAFTEADALSGS